MTLSGNSETQMTATKAPSGIWNIETINPTCV